MSTFIINWDPRTEGGRVALLKTLDEKLAGYQTTFPAEITNDVITIVHKAYVMGDWLLTGSLRADEAKLTINGYKGHLFDGPANTSMTNVPTPAVYGTTPAVAAAGIMSFVSNLRGLLVRNPAWTDNIAKDLQLYGTDGSFIPAEYVPHFSVNPFVGYIHIHVSTKHVHGHHVYIRKAGTATWDAPVMFNGANFDLRRTGADITENLEIMLKGVINNVETPLPSDIIAFLYKSTL